MRITRIEDRECRDLLGRVGFGRLGCARDNQPYIVPIYFAYESDQLYGFATLGQKIEWMRSNPHVCVQSDEVVNRENWTSVVVLGRYEEFADTPKYSQQRNKVQALLQKRSDWWQTGYVASTIRGNPEAPSPVFFCIHVQEISGLRASPEGAPVRVR
jgi:nitroimidazol reductase NimA-like FMN-containing flavoprotein (pyridoxamine 5'-phosphate oxidase superfamily)